MKAELAIRAAKLFTPKPWCHTYSSSSALQDTPFCTRCNTRYETWPDGHENYSKCTVPDPIVIDWSVAMKLVRECRAYVNVHVAMQEIYRNHKYQDAGFAVWAIFVATPADYILAACVAKETENGRTDKEN